MQLSFDVADIISPQVNNNGDITFDGPLGSFTSSPFPLSNNRQMIAPYWADVDTRRGGRVWYREASSDAALLMRARNEIRTSLVSQMNFQPTFLFIATWESVAYFIRGGSSNLVCQIVLVGIWDFDAVLVFSYTIGVSLPKSNARQIGVIMRAEKYVEAL